jgi:hypothetical protein
MAAIRARASPANLGVAAVALLAVAVRLPGVWRWPFWEDEVASARILREPTFTSMVHRVVSTESTPPLWYSVGWLVHWIGVPLQDERLLSVLFGAATAALTVLLARRFVQLPLALAAGAMTALGGEFVGHGHELRAYELLALLSLVFGIYLLRALEGGSQRDDILLAGATALGGLTHFFFAFSALSALAWLWLDRGASRVRTRMTVALVCGGALAAAWIPGLLMQYKSGHFWWIGSFRTRYVIAVPLRLFTYAYSREPLGQILSAAAVVVLLVGALHLARRSREGRLVVVLAIAPILAAAAVWAAGMPIFDLRNLIGVGSFVAVAFVAAFDRLPRPLPAVVAVGIAAALGVSLAVSRADRIPRYDLMARALVHEGWRASAPIAVFGDPFLYKAPLEWYLPRQPFLQISRPVQRPVCPLVFIIKPNGAVLREHFRVSIENVARLQGATLLADATHPPRCVRPALVRHPATVA